MSILHLFIAHLLDRINPLFQFIGKYYYFVYATVRRVRHYTEIY